MAIPLVINGVTFEYPVDFDAGWGVNATGWAQAVTNGMLQKAGGSFPLTTEVDFGASFGIKTLYVKSRETNPSSTGIIRLANTSTGIGWRNFANTGDLILTTDSSNNLLYNGVPIGSSNTLTNTHIFVGNASNVPTDVPMSGDVHIASTGATTIQPAAVTGSKIAASTVAEANIVPGTITNASINAIAAIVMSKLIALNAFIVPVTDTNGFLTNSATTATELGYVHGVTSNIQTQFNAITGAGQFVSGMGMPFFGSAVPSGWLLCDGSAVSRTTYSSLFGAIGIVFGPGDGSTTFNLPTGTDFTFVGKGGTIAPTLGSTSGALTSPVAHSHTISHQHDTGFGSNTITAYVDNTWAPVSSRNVNYGAWSQADNTATPLNYYKTSDSLTPNSGTTTVSPSTVQPSLGINWIIKT